MNTRRLLPLLAGLALLLGRPLPAAAAADPAEARLGADLIWGTNGEPPAAKTFKPIPPDLEKRLGRIFKWKHYFIIEQKEFTVAPGKPAKVDMSKECRLEVNRAAGEEFEIQLFGKGHMVVKKRQRIVPGETVVLGGDDKNDDAWFVILGLAPTRPPARP
jgi:hypothetical protein